MPILTLSSGGTITLNTTSVWDQPLIDLNFMSTQLDLDIMREAYKSVRTFLAAPAFDGYIAGPWEDAAVTSDEDIETYIRNYTSTIWHPTGTAMMTAEDADYGVTNPDLSVKNVTGLRVIDASIMVSFLFAMTSVRS